MSYNNSTVQECYRLVREFFENEPEKVTPWFCSPNPFLGGVSPNEMIQAGREERLLRFIKSSILENVTEWC